MQCGAFSLMARFGGGGGSLHIFYEGRGWEQFLKTGKEKMVCERSMKVNEKY